MIYEQTIDLLSVEDGDTGSSSFIHIKYSNDGKTFTGNGGEDAGIYMGIYSDNIQEDSTTFSDYTWKKIVGEDAYTIILSNENISFSVDKDMLPLSNQSFTCSVSVLKGTSVYTNYTVSAPSAKNGLTISVANKVITVAASKDTAISSNAGSIDVTVTVDDKTFTKTLTYSVSMSGDDGAAGVSVTSTSVKYYKSTSSSTLSGGSWSDTAPEWENGTYIWSKTVTTYSSGSLTESDPVCITGEKGNTGADGATGTGIVSIVAQYYLSTSKTTQTGGSWKETPDEWSSGKYMWTRNKITYKNPTSVSYTEPVCSSEWEAANTVQENLDKAVETINSSISGVSSRVSQTEKSITDKVWQTDIETKINNYDNTTVETIRERVTQTEIDITGINSTVKDVQSSLKDKADGITVQELQTKITEVEQSVDNYKISVSETYATKESLDNLEIGGRNLIRNSAFLSNSDYWEPTGTGVSIDTEKTYNGHPSLKITMSGLTSNMYRGAWIYYLPEKPTKILAGETYTASCYYYVEDASLLGDYSFALQIKGTKDEATDIVSIGNIRIYATDCVIGEWTKIQFTFTSDIDYSDCCVFPWIQRNGTVWFTDFKLEKGNKATDWTPAPEDTEASITEVKTIATQTAKKFNWLVASGDSSTSFTLTDRMAELIADTISLNGNVKVNGDMLVDGCITANKIDVTDLFAQDIVASGSITGVTLNGATGNFTGSVTATTLIATQGGTIGGWYISNTRLRTSNSISLGSAEEGMLLINEEGKAYIWVQNSTGDTMFSISRSGSMFAKNASISGSIIATSITAKNEYYIHASSGTGTKARALYSADGAVGTSLMVGDGFSVLYLKGLIVNSSVGQVYCGEDSSWKFTAGQFITSTNHAGSWYNGLSGAIPAINVSNAGSTSGVNWLASVRCTDGAWGLGVYNYDSSTFYLSFASNDLLNAGTNSVTRHFKFGTGGSFTAYGEITAGSSTSNAFRAVFGNYGFIIRNDGNNTYFMTTASGDPYGSWNKYITMVNSDCSLLLPSWATFANGYGVRGKNSSGTIVNLIRWDSGNYCYVADYNNKPTKLRLSQTCSNIGVLNSSGSWITITTGVSDRREKNNINPLEKYKEIIMGLKPKRFKYNDPEDDRLHLGFVAQDVRETLDATIGDCAILEYNNSDPDEIRQVDMDDESTFIYSMRYNELIAPHIALTQEHEIRINKLEERIRILEEENKILKGTA